MKKILLTICIVATAFSLSAQDAFSAKSEGTWLANGTLFINYTSTKLKADGNTRDVGTTFEVRASPRAAYFVQDNIAVGLELFLTTSSTSFDDIDTTVSTSGISVGPFGRYYFNNGLFAEGLIGFGSTNTSTDDDFSGGTDLSSSVFGWRLGAGYAFFLGDHVAVEPSLNYSWESQNPDNGDVKNIISSIFIGVGISAFF